MFQVDCPLHEGACVFMVVVGGGGAGVDMKTNLIALYRHMLCTPTHALITLVPSTFVCI